MTMNEDTTEDELAFEDMMDTAEAHIEDEMEEFDGGEVPNHAGRLLVQRAADLNGTLVNIEVVENSEEEITEEEIGEALAEDAVEIILALGALKYEHDLDIESAYAERMELMEAAMEADNQMELMEAVMDEEELEEAKQMMNGAQVGDDVSAEDYDPEGVDRTFA